jgi:hypothetical protein
MSRKYTYVVSLAGAGGPIRFADNTDQFGNALRRYLDTGTPRAWECQINGSQAIIALPHVTRADITETETKDA